MNKSNYDREIKRRVKKRKKDAQKAQDESIKNKKSGKYKQRRKCGTKIRHHKNKVYEESKEEQMAKKIREGKKSYESDERKRRNSRRGHGKEKSGKQTRKEGK